MESCHAKWLMATEKPLTDSILHGPERPPSTLTENAFWGPFVNAGFSASGKGSVDLKKKKKNEPSHKNEKCMWLRDTDNVAITCTHAREP